MVVRFPVEGLYSNTPVSSNNAFDSLWKTTGKSVFELESVTVTVVAAVAVPTVNSDRLTSASVSFTLSEVKRAPAPPNTAPSITSVTNWLEEFNTTTLVLVPAAKVAVIASAVIVPLELILPEAVTFLV